MKRLAFLFFGRLEVLLAGFDFTLNVISSSVRQNDVKVKNRKLRWKIVIFLIDLTDCSVETVNMEIELQLCLSFVCHSSTQCFYKTQILTSVENGNVKT